MAKFSSQLVACALENPLSEHGVVEVSGSSLRDGCSMGLPFFPPQKHPVIYLVSHNLNKTLLNCILKMRIK